MVLALFSFGCFVFNNELVDATLGIRYLSVFAILLLALIGLAKHFRLYIEQEFRWLDLFLFAFCLWEVISVLWATNTAQAFGASFRSVALFLAYLFLRVVLVNNSKWYKCLPELVSVVSSVYLMFVWVQLLQLNQSIGLNAQTLYALNYPSATKNLTSIFVLMAVHFQIHVAITSKGWKRWLTAVSVIASIGTLFLLSTRGVSLSILAIGVSLFFVQIAFKQHRFKFGLPLAALIVALGIGHWFTSSELKTRSIAQYEKHQTSEAQGSKEEYSDHAYRSTNERFALWEKTMYLIRDNPVLGVGSGNWQILHPINGLDGLERAEYRITSFLRPHNLVLRVLSETGVIGLILFSLVIVTYFIQAAKSNKPSLVLAMAMVGLLTAAMFSFPLERMEHNLLFASILALSISTESKVNFKKHLSLVVFGSLFILVTAGVVINTFRFQGELEYSTLFRLKKQNKYVECINQSYNTENMLYSVDWLNYPFAWYRGMCYHYLGDHQKAAPEFEEAIRLNPGNFHSHNNLGLCIAQQGNYEEAIPYFEHSLSINNKFEDARFNLAYSLIKLNRPEEAMEAMSVHIRDSTKLRVYQAEAEKLLIE